MEENPPNVSPNTGSLSDINLHTATGDDRLMGVLYKKIEDLAKEVHELKTQKIIDETQMPPELLDQNGMLPDEPTKVDRGRGWRPLLRSEIEDAIAKAGPFCSDQAKYLGVCPFTLKKYAKPLGLWKPQPNHKGSKKPWGPEKGKYPLSKILKGEFNDNKLVTDWMVKKKVLKAGATEACAICGYNKRHLINGKVPLLLDHMDGNRQNFKAENIRLLCWNCTVECGRGYLRRGIRFFDPDWRTDGKE